MSQEVTLLVVGACGFGLLCMLVGVFAYKWFRHTVGKFFIVGIVNKMIDDTKEEVNDVDVDEGPLRASHFTRADLEAIARREKSQSEPLSSQSASAAPLEPRHSTLEPHRSTPDPKLRRHRGDGEDFDDELLDDLRE